MPKRPSMVDESQPAITWKEIIKGSQVEPHFAETIEMIDEAAEILQNLSAQMKRGTNVDLTQTLANQHTLNRVVAMLEMFLTVTYLTRWNAKDHPIWEFLEAQRTAGDKRMSNAGLSEEDREQIVARLEAMGLNKMEITDAMMQIVKEREAEPDDDDEEDDD